MKIRRIVEAVLTSAACVVASTSTTFAQSHVTLYGVLDGGILFTNKTYDHISGREGGRAAVANDGNESPSRIGLSGSEQLGGGVEAIFDLETGIDISSGKIANSNGNFFGRQAWVGIKGGFGNVKVGLQYSPFVLALVKSDPRGGTFFGSGSTIYVGNLYATGLFNKNAISYESPMLYGFQGSAMLGLGGKAGDFQAGRQYSASLHYESHGLGVNVAIYKSNAGAQITSPVPDGVPFLGKMVGVSYDFGAASAKLLAAEYKIDNSFDIRMIGVGGEVRVMPTLYVDAGVWLASDANRSENSTLIVGSGLQYFLSKTTQVYVQAGMVKNRGGMHTGMAINGALYGPTGTTLGAAIGLRREF
ncbi:porin [Burkholderia ambifaria]|uniref:Porin Gram-negative type n=1 Tax=Burkholderia ambifaria MEX-5 TaxID=396597 RepID=B1SXT5_9BURK|nr:porin [Burkholderia ambifaria]EDT43844.1 porin Gram-negative type [Burkholderia ambifaria MEX-5]